MVKYIWGMYIILLFTEIFKAVWYCEVVRINMSCLEASTWFYWLFYEGEIEFLFTLTFKKISCLETWVYVHDFNKLSTVKL